MSPVAPYPAPPKPRVPEGASTIVSMQSCSVREGMGASRWEVSR